MMDRLSDEERRILLKLARQGLEQAVRGEKITPLKLSDLPPKLREPGVTFVTLTRKGLLRGCIGALSPTTSLAEDVREHAIAAGMQDYRFQSVSPAELPEIEIEISRLTPPQDLSYETPDELLKKIKPDVDGVTIMDGYRRATFLPQVWKKIPESSEFLKHLCHKMGADPDLWRNKKLRVQTYQVEEFHE